MAADAGDGGVQRGEYDTVGQLPESRQRSGEFGDPLGFEVLDS